MKEKLKKYLYLTAYRTAAAAVVFAVILIAGYFVPGSAQKIKRIITHNTDFNKVIKLFSQAMKELLPF